MVWARRSRERRLHRSNGSFQDGSHSVSAGKDLFDRRWQDSMAAWRKVSEGLGSETRKKREPGRVPAAEIRRKKVEFLSTQPVCGVCTNKGKSPSCLSTIALFLKSGSLFLRVPSPRHTVTLSWKARSNPGDKLLSIYLWPMVLYISRSLYIHNPGTPHTRKITGRRRQSCGKQGILPETRIIHLTLNQTSIYI